MLPSSWEQSQAREEPQFLEDCLKLLKGGRDEQRLAGLLLVTKFCKADDHASIRRVYDAVGAGFLDRLLRTGMGKGSASVIGVDDRDAYLQLSLSVLAAFCRVPEIASSSDMISNIPLVLEVTVNKFPCPRSNSPVLEDCYEFLFLVSTASEIGSKMLCESGAISVLSSQISAFTDGSHLMELAMKLLHSMLSNLSTGTMKSEDLSITVPTIARQFAVLHTALKFEAFHLLCAILGAESMASMHDALPFMQTDLWSIYIRVGIIAILQNRVAPDEKLQALSLADSMISLLGEEWLLGQLTLPDTQDPVPPERCMLLVLESARVEIAVLLNDLAYLKYEASQTSSSNTQTILKQKNLAVAFALVEKIIKLISKISVGVIDSFISESTLTKVIFGLNETVGIVLDYLQDAKEHGQNKCDDLLASVRIVSSYLAETPIACWEKMRELLGYMLSVEGDAEASPFYSICFLLPMLCQITMEDEGCEVLVSSGGYKAVAECLIKFIGPEDHMTEDSSSIFLACDTIMNLLLKREKMHHLGDESMFINLLKSLVHWADDTDSAFIVMMASALCTLILGYTSEEALLNHPEFDHCTFHELSRLVARSLVMGQQEMPGDGKEADLHEIVSQEYCRWAHRFPRIKDAVEG